MILRNQVIPHYFIVFDAIFKLILTNKGATATYIKEISIFFENGRYREGYKAVAGSIPLVFESGLTYLPNQYTAEPWLRFTTRLSNIVRIYDFRSQTHIQIARRGIMLNLNVKSALLKFGV